MIKNALRKLEEINATLLNIVTFWVGAAMVVIGYFVSAYNEKLEIVLVSTGTSIVASTIIVFLSAKYLFKQSKIKEIIETWGLEGIFRTRAEMNLNCNLHLLEMEKELDIIAFGLRSFRDSQSDLLQKKVKNGLKIRVLTISPNSFFLKQREKDEKEIEGHMKNTIIQLAEWLSWLKQSSPDADNNIQIRYYDTLPLDFYFRQDEYLYIGPYLWGLTSQQTISYEFRANSQGYDYYKSYFENLWNNTNFAKADYTQFTP
ncbi:MAG: hypothetical protein EPGJADBJ_04883 [Saprospiraceae bacterium]|nr:hypothetical protein [Saprospiraceae bacterium]